MTFLGLQVEAYPPAEGFAPFSSLFTDGMIAFDMLGNDHISSSNGM